MRGGLYVCRLARPNCNTLTLSFYILTESEPHPRRLCAEQMGETVEWMWAASGLFQVAGWMALARVFLSLTPASPSGRSPATGVSLNPLERVG
jgi:hypothetical protein